MVLPLRKDKGFSLVELLVVIAIITILSVVGAYMIGNRQGAAVRALMDEVEGALANANKAAVATSRDVAVATWGIWGDPANPLVLAQGDATLGDDPFRNTANGLLQGTAPSPTIPFSQTVAVGLVFRRDDSAHSRARITEATSGDWAAAMGDYEGRTNQNIATVAPFNSGGAMVGVVDDANNLSRGLFNRSVISGTSKRFNSTFIIRIVGTNSNGTVLPGSPLGLVVVLGNGSTIYKFYNPGIREGDGQWRKI